METRICSRARTALALAAALLAASCGLRMPEPPAPNDPGRPISPEPSEEITPEELATIPEPVPPSSTEPPAPPPRPPGSASRAPSDATRPIDGAEQSPVVPGDAGGWIWRVQVFASEWRVEAERIAEEAGRRLNVSAVVEYEAPLYKVRLGRFANEAEAMTLRALAIRAGYPGAFRTKTTARISDVK